MAADQEPYPRLAPLLPESEIVRSLNKVRARHGLDPVVLAPPISRLHEQFSEAGKRLAHEQETVEQGWTLERRRLLWLLIVSIFRRSTTAPGAPTRVLSALLPASQADDWLAEAKDHLVSVAEAGEKVRPARRGLFVALVISLPIAWYGELRRRWLRRA